MKLGHVKGIPPTCQELGCGGASCKYYKSMDEFPYYRCTHYEDDTESEVSQSEVDHET
jgi:hypothetical protein